MMFHHCRTERGIAALIALIMVGMLTLIGIAVMSTSDDEVAITGNQLQETRAFYAAESGLEMACAAIQEEYETTNLPPTEMPEGDDEINSSSFTYSTVDQGAAKSKVLSTGSLAGLNSLTKSFDVAATGISSVDSAKVTLRQTFETSLVPLFQFAVFYGNDLEIAPGPDMNLIGRVHSNGNLYIQANNKLTLDSYVTASGDVIHGRKGAGGAGSGDVQIKNAAGTYVSMKEGSSEWLDSKDAYWYDSSVSRWNGRVRDEAHGQQELNIPLFDAGGDPRKLIEPAAGGNDDSYENKATLKIVNGQAFKKSGSTWTNVTADMTAKGIITYNADKFTDQREGKTIDCTEFDIQKMYDNGYGPANGVMYFSDDISGGGEFPGLRIKNGSELDGPLTIASNNPVYTLGDFNETNKQPASIMADALTMLSGAWNDANSALNKSDRVANATTVNCCYIAGNKASTSTVYNGGFENLPRFLESWNGKTLTWTGSAVNLWYSEQAVGNWDGWYYDPPTRAWQYDTDLDDPTKLPPESPVFRLFSRTGWKQEYVGYEDND